MSIINVASSQKTMTSREIASLTGKEHKNVAADIRKMTVELGLDALTFQRIYKDGSNRDQIEYALDQELTYTLLTSYSTPLRNKVIQRWRELESTAPDPLSALPADQRAIVMVMIENAAIKEQLNIQAEAIKRIESNQMAAIASVQNFTALGYSIFKEIPMSKIELIRLGKKASAISKKKGITIDHVADGRHGRVGSYHISVLDEALEQITT